MSGKGSRIWLGVVFICLIFSSGIGAAKKPEYPQYLAGEYWKNQALNEIIPFWVSTRDEKGGGFFTDIQNDGSVASNPNKYPRMNSRVIYGFCTAYLLGGDERYLELARHGLEYLKNYGWDRQYGGWFTELNVQNQPTAQTKDLFDQTYGNLGPIFYYYLTGDQTALNLVQQSHRLLNEKAWDKAYDGYYAWVNADWSVTNTGKSFNSQIDTATAYLIYYYLATRDSKLLANLEAIGKVAVNHMFDPAAACIRESYTRQWKPTRSYLGDREQIDVGHNLKTAWVLLRTYQLTGDPKYLSCARKIAARMLATAWDAKYFGWYMSKNAKRAAKTDQERAKCWWTQTEGNFMLLNLYNVTGDKQYLDYFTRNAYFWDHYMVDHRDKEVYGYTSQQGKPIKGLKGNLYKSAYHSMENALLNYLYLQLYVNRKPATLYFNLSVATGGSRHYVKIVEDPGVVIQKVELNQQDWKQFDAKAGYVVLPKGENMKLKVTFQKQKN
ncbi:MAG TPA: AGE family epimerase/isomerase [Bacillota bacterium]|nr:AGE family epimerase/isomerase [Bacillota bacterium]